MTHSTITVQAASDGGTTTDQTRPARREHGLAVLRAKEAKELVGLSTDAIHEASKVAHDLFEAIYDIQHTLPGEHAEPLLEETLTCLQTGEHYLLMLGSVLDQCVKPTGDQDPTGTAL